MCWYYMREIPLCLHNLVAKLLNIVIDNQAILYHKHVRKRETWKTMSTNPSNTTNALPSAVIKSLMDNAKSRTLAPIPTWVRHAIEFAKMSQADLSRKMIASGFNTFDRAAVNKLTLGSRSLKADEMIEISRITGFPMLGATASLSSDFAVGKVHRARGEVATFECLLRLLANVFEIVGMSEVEAEKFGAAISKLARQQKDDVSEEQIRGQARALVAIFWDSSASESKAH